MAHIFLLLANIWQLPSKWSILSEFGLLFILRFKDICNLALCTFPLVKLLRQTQLLLSILHQAHSSSSFDMPEFIKLIKFAFTKIQIMKYDLPLDLAYIHLIIEHPIHTTVYISQPGPKMEPSKKSFNFFAVSFSFFK